MMEIRMSDDSPVVDVELEPEGEVPEGDGLELTNDQRLRLVIFEILVRDGSDSLPVIVALIDIVYRWIRDYEQPKPPETGSKKPRSNANLTVVPTP